MNKQFAATIRSQRTRMKIKPHSNCYRLSVFRSNKHLYAQVIDDQTKKTLVSSSNIEKSAAKESINNARQIGIRLAKKALDHKIKKVYFDRGRFTYQGRIKELAEGAREGGLVF